jgi:hypothetical protein
MEYPEPLPVEANLSTSHRTRHQPKKMQNKDVAKDVAAEELAS